eukprot:scaffold1311_cov256-Pinguiococcus_pyrenoidosus.AAC.2
MRGFPQFKSGRSSDWLVGTAGDAGVLSGAHRSRWRMRLYAPIAMLAGIRQELRTSPTDVPLAVEGVPVVS